MNLPPINCALCKKPVDQTTTERDICYSRVKITVQCHDEIDQMTLDDEFIENRGLEHLSEGLAFNPKLLESIKETERQLKDAVIIRSKPRTTRPEQEIRRDALSLLNAITSPQINLKPR